MTTMSIPRDTAQMCGVRRALQSELAASGTAGQVAEDVVLIASELITNAIRHAAPLPDGLIRVGWEVTDDDVRVEVTDGGGPDITPAVRRPGRNELNGRGLSIVEALADRWGVDPRPAGTTVWAVRAR